MHNFYSTGFILGLIFFAFAKAETLAQTEIEDILTDLVLITDRYIEPAAEASAFQSASAWAYSAASLDFFDFEIGLHANALVIPRREQLYDISNDELRNVRLRGRTQADLPTALGGRDRTEFEFTLLGEIYEFSAFEGVNYDVLPHPYVQARMGLWYDTEIILRYAPSLTIDRSDYDIFGVGLKHDFSRWWKENEAVHLAGLVSYSVYDLNLFFDPFEFRSNNNDVPLAIIEGSLIDSYAWTFSLLGSKRWKNWELMLGLTHTESYIDYRLVGNDSAFLDLLNQVLVILSEYRQGFKGDVGLTYHLNDWKISSNYSIGQFYNFNLGGVYRF